MRRAVAVAVVVAWLLTPAAALARCPKTSVAAMEHDVMCPVCGTSLAVARDAPLARRERAFIGRLAGQCRSATEIKAALVAQYGDEVLATPPRRGFDLSAYLVPFAAALLAAALLALAVVRRRRPPGVEAPAPALGADDARRLAAELERLR
jgi:cytochrome c-type biogenesis protein CcmH